jgi:hypothetical protein
MNKVEQTIIDRLTELLQLVDIDDLQFEIEKFDLIEVTAINPHNNERIPLLKLEVRESNQSIYIPNLFLPPAMRKLGLAMRILYLILMIALNFGYRVYLILITEETGIRMLNRGALATADPNVIEIVRETNLYSDNDPNNPRYI